MEPFSLSQNIDPNKIFLVNRAELEGRLEVEYYLPQISKLEKSIREKSTKKLRDYALKLSSGATPSVSEEEKFYGTQENGIPFLRVQNLQTNAKLNLADVKYINKETHEGYLKRSQVSQHDLLVKITGVGRMAIASVAPSGFLGNTNQHMVVVKTERKEISEYLANYLNLDIVEKIASRRSTGATRPALDYPALKSIPIIEDIDFSVIEKAVFVKQQKESEAKSLLESIDTYLLDQLGITLPEQDNSLQNRIFTTKFSLVSGSRFDPNYALNFGTILSQKPKYPFVRFQDIFLKKPQYGANEEAVDGNPNSDVRYIRITDVDEWGNLRTETWKTAKKIEPIYLLNENDILIARTGATVGKAFIYKETNDKAIFAGYMIRFFLNQEKINPDFAFYYLNSSFFKFWVSAIQRPSAQPNINSEEYKSLLISLPPLEKQNEIANHIQAIRVKAKALQQEAAKLLEDAKKQVEQMIIGE